MLVICGSIVLSLLGVLAYALILIAVSATLGGSDAALGLGGVLAQLVQLPFSLASLLSVLLVAVPALLQRGEVVTIAAASQMLRPMVALSPGGAVFRSPRPLAFCSASFRALRWRWSRRCS